LYRSTRALVLLLQGHYRANQWMWWAGRFATDIQVFLTSRESNWNWILESWPIFRNWISIAIFVCNDEGIINCHDHVTSSPLSSRLPRFASSPFLSILIIRVYLAMSYVAIRAWDVSSGCHRYIPHEVMVGKCVVFLLIFEFGNERLKVKSLEISNGELPKRWFLHFVFIDVRDHFQIQKIGRR